MTQPTPPLLPTLEQAWRALMFTIAKRNPNRVKANRIIVRALNAQQRRRS